MEKFPTTVPQVKPLAQEVARRQEHDLEESVKGRTREKLSDERQARLGHVVEQLITENVRREQVRQPRGRIQESIQRYVGNMPKPTQEETIFSFPYELIHEFIDEKTSGHFLHSLTVSSLLEDERYDLLEAKMNKLSLAERLRLRLFGAIHNQLSESFESTSKSLIQDGRFRMARSLVNARERLYGKDELSIKARVELDEKEHIAKDSDIPEHYFSPDEPKEAVETPHYAAGFYVDEYIRLGISWLQRAPDFQSRISTDLRMALLRLQDSVSVRTRGTVNRVRRYLIRAIASELAFQTKGHPKYFYVQARAHLGEKIIPQMLTDREDVLNFLRTVRNRFGNGYEGSFGGKPWQAIADVAYELWRTDDIQKLVPLVDRVFQLEHNNGTVFNKDYDDFKNDPMFTLNAKFIAGSLAQFLALLKGGKVEPVKSNQRYPILYQFSPQALNEITARLKEAQQVFKRAQKYFPMEAKRALETVDTELKTGPTIYTDESLQIADKE